MTNYGDTLSSEEKLEQVWRFMNQLKANGLDLFAEEGYLQLGSPSLLGSQRFDKRGHQVVSTDSDGDGVGQAALWFVPRLTAKPGPVNNAASVFPRVQVSGLAETATPLAFFVARADGVYNDTSAWVEAFASDASTSVALTASNAANSPNSVAKLELSNTDGGPATLRFYGNGTTVDLGGGGMSLIVKEADETVNNSTTLQNDDELLFAVAANEVFQFEGVLNLTTNPTPGFRMTFTGPTGAVGSFSAIYGDMLTGNADAASGPLGSPLQLASAQAGATVRFWGGIHNGATAGNLTLQWAQNTADASNTKVLAGSYIKYQKET